jgi:hypothetical protein
MSRRDTDQKVEEILKVLSIAGLQVKAGLDTSSTE